ncbi:MAG: hypothetical protein CBB95_17685 [Alteromonas sp. TMED35]|jgi:hypothetical protein|uniref:hypothetical protein n=1 Tax=uncultured Alteromonas sp. TaxID=179113 RepID=UPI000B633C10|nr:MAG: hypothetical protein CBB95_17685 [Alteromonas sp. TMED35]|tara:strand:+ start:35353 stop:35892 length:540 start_codon:yes stop_codon:yes gene_type:complete
MFNTVIKQMVSEGESYDDIIFYLIENLAMLIENKEQPLLSLQKSKILLDKLVDQLRMVNEQMSLNVAIEEPHDAFSSDEEEFADGDNECFDELEALDISELRKEIDADIQEKAEHAVAMIEQEEAAHLEATKMVENHHNRIVYINACANNEPLLYDGIDMSLVPDGASPVSYQETICQH